VKILVIAEYIARRRWFRSHLAGSIVLGLARRGHEIELACDNVGDPARFTGIRLSLHRPLSSSTNRHPARFMRWAARQRDRAEHDVSLSFSRVAPADCWMPIGVPAASGAAALIRSLRPASVVMELSHQPWIPAAIACERLAARHATTARRLALGSVDGLGYMSTIVPPGASSRDALRRRTRDLLGIGPDEMVVLISDVHFSKRPADALFAGMASLGEAPTLLAVGHSGYSVLRSARRAGLRRVCIAGPTGRMDAALAAADVCAAPFPTRHGAGRLVADSLLMGRPILAHPEASGASLVGGAGALVETPTSAGWRDALAPVMNPRRREALSAFASEADVSEDAFLARLERALSGA
jgi:hypothetical protein